MFADPQASSLRIRLIPTTWDFRSACQGLFTPVEGLRDLLNEL